MNNERIAPVFIRSKTSKLPKFARWNEVKGSYGLTGDTKYELISPQHLQGRIVSAPGESKEAKFPKPCSSVPSWKVVLDGIYAVVFLAVSYGLCAWIIFEMEYSLWSFWP